jgi:Leucine-rich repeat (LRR) protein
MPWLTPQWLGTAVFFLVLFGSLGGWWMVHSHLLASSGLMVKGGKVHWDWSEGWWLRGGRTTVDFADRGYDLKDEDLAGLPELNHVVELNLSGCASLTSEGLAVLAKLPELERLDLSDHDPLAYSPRVPAKSYLPHVTDKTLDRLRGLTRLRELHLGGAGITDQGMAKLAGLQNLETLDVTRTKVTNAGLVHLKGLKRLRTLIVDSTGVTPEGDQLLLQANPNLTIEHPVIPQTDP